MLQKSEQAIEQPIKNDVNDPKWYAIRTAVDKLEFFKSSVTPFSLVKLFPSFILQISSNESITRIVF